MKIKIFLMIAISVPFVINSFCVAEACIRLTTAQPDTNRADAGFDIIPGAVHYTVFPGSEELGMFNHGPMLAYFEDRLFVTWYSHRRYEDAPGTRALFSYTIDKVRLDNSGLGQGQPIKWSQPQVLIDSIGDMAGKDSLGVAMWPVLEVVDNRLYVHATVKQIIGWQGEGTTTSPTYENLPRIAREITADGKPTKQLYWMSSTTPQGIENILPFTKATPIQTGRGLDKLNMVLSQRGRNYPYPQSLDGAEFCEPTYFTRPDGKEVGVYRDLKRSLRLYAAIRNNPTNPWSPALQTNIPDSPSKTVAGSLPDGSIYLIGNFLDNLWLRDPLLLAHSKDGINFDKVYAIRCGAAQVREKTPGDHKGPGFQYPDAVVIGDSLWISYSISKEQIALSRIPLGALN